MAQNIAYLRVSTLGQDLEKNKSEILHLANGRNLVQVLDDLSEGDAVLLSEVSRLGRSMLECISIAIQKGIRIYGLN